MSNFSILHLYPNTLHLNGEAGNVLALTERGKEHGLVMELNRVELGERLPNQRPDLIFIGSGILSATRVASEDLAVKAKKLLEWIASGTKVLAVGAGFDLISNGLETETGIRLFGLGLSNTIHRLTKTHLVGEVLAEGGVAGFINWNREILREDDGTALTTVVSSDNADLVGYVDGYRSPNVIATNIQGPFLPMNPSFADELLGVDGGKSDNQRLNLLDELAEKSRSAISRRVNR